MLFYRGAAGVLRCFYGINTLTAMTIITQIFDFGRQDGFQRSDRLASYFDGITGIHVKTGKFYGDYIRFIAGAFKRGRDG